MTYTNEKVSTLNHLFKEINQVCIVTNDFEKTVDGLSKDLGIGPFKCWNHKLPSLFNSKYYGHEVDFKMRLAIAWVGKTQFEVIQPLEGPNIYRDYLKTHGEGVQHILLDTGNLSVEQTIKQLAKVDCGVIQEGMLDIKIKLGFLNLPSTPPFLLNLLSPKFFYLDTESIAKTTIELLQLPLLISHQRGINIGRQEYWLPEGNPKFNSSLTNSFISEIFKIGIVTYDLDQTLRNYVERMGIGPWKIYNLESPRLSQTKLRGKNINLSMRMAVTYVGNTLLEIVQPLEGSSIYNELLSKHGEGVHYLGVSSENLNFYELIEHFGKLGCSIAMEGKLENAYDFAYLDTKSLAKTMMEVVSVPTKEISVALESLKPDKIYPDLG